MPKLLSGFIAKQIAKGLGRQVKPATLIKVTTGTRTPGSISGGLAQTETSYRARGWIDEYGSGYVPGSTTRREARKVALLGATIAGKQIPTSGDKVTIEGVTYRIAAVPERDPDAAVYMLEVAR
jgi:hypothetical protein